MFKKYTHTIYACYIGYIVQAIINNLAPLLFLTFQREFSISVELIGLLITVNFGTQIIVDFVAAKYVDKIGYRTAVILAHVCSVVGLIGFGVFPFIMINSYYGLVCAMICSAIGGGLIEVLISPIVEATPSSGAKETAMSLLHSFYCWGHVAVVVLSTIGFQILGMEHWYYLPIIWSIVPILNIFLFAQVPIETLVSEEEQISANKLLSMKKFWLLFLLMLCSGASEQAMSQWASLFAEEGLKQSKVVGDLLGPCFFAVMMGIARMFYGKFGEKIELKKFMIGSGVLCVISYMIAVCSQNPILSLVGCGLCGLSVGIMWPGTLSLSAKTCPQGGTFMFALLALAGDLGCSVGPGLVSIVSGAVTEYGIKSGLGAAIVFPIVMIFLLVNNRNKLR